MLIAASLPTVYSQETYRAVPVAVRSTAWVCGGTIARIAGSNTVGGMDVCGCVCVGGWVLVCVCRMSLGLCVGVCDCMTVDVVGSCMHLK